MYYGKLYRTEKSDEEPVTFYSGKIPIQHTSLGVGGGEPFVTPIALWESFNDVYSTDTVKFVPSKIIDNNGDTIDSKYYVGDKVYPHSRINDFEFEYVLTPFDVAPFGTYITVGDTIWIKEHRYCKICSF